MRINEDSTNVSVDIRALNSGGSPLETGAYFT